MRKDRFWGRPVLLPSVVLSLVAATWAWGPLPRASAELDQTTEWGVSARADAMAVEYINTSSPVFGSEPVIYGTPASAASLVDSVGQSTAWAAAPYPGDIMVGAADNGNGTLVGAGLPGIFASYPFYVETTGSRTRCRTRAATGWWPTASSTCRRATPAAASSPGIFWPPSRPGRRHDRRSTPRRAS